MNRNIITENVNNNRRPLLNLQNLLIINFSNTSKLNENSTIWGNPLAKPALHQVMMIKYAMQRNTIPGNIAVRGQITVYSDDIDK